MPPMWLLQQAQKMSPSKLAAEFAAEDEDLPATFTRDDIIREGSEPFDDDNDDRDVGAFGDIHEELEWSKAELRRVHQVRSGPVQAPSSSVAACG